MGYIVLPGAEAELDDIWLYVARESGSIEIANRLTDAIAERFFLLDSIPKLGGAAITICSPASAVFPWRIRNHLPDCRR